MKTRNYELDNYLMRPTVMSNGLLLYPIKMPQYDDFRNLAYKYIVLSVKKINNQLRQQWEKQIINKEIPNDTKFVPIKKDTLFEYLISICEESLKTKQEIIKQINERNKAIQQQINKLSKEEMTLLVADNPNILDEIEIIDINELNLKTACEEIIELIEMVVKNKVVFEGNCFIVYFKSNTYIIDKNNFEEFRKIVCNQNLLFEPRIGANLSSQKAIDREMKNMFKEETSLEAMVACLGDIDFDNITYYRLKAMYEAYRRKLDYIACSVYRANGNTLEGGGAIPIPNLLEPLKLNTNPYYINRKEVNQDEINKTIDK